MPASRLLGMASRCVLEARVQFPAGIAYCTQRHIEQVVQAFI